MNVKDKVFHSKLKKFFEIEFINETTNQAIIKNGNITVMYVPLDNLTVVNDNNNDVNIDDVIEFECSKEKFTHKLVENDELFEDALYTNKQFFRFDSGFRIIQKS